MQNQMPLEEVSPEAFVPYTVAGYGQEVIFVHTAGDPAAFSRSLTTAVLRLDRSVIPQQILSMDEILELSAYARPRFGLVLFSVFAGIGLVLVTIGVYSVVSWTVAQQRREIGIRMVLGASPGDVRLQVLAGTLRFVLMGLALGMLLTWAVRRLLASQLWKVSGYDPVTLIAVIAVLVLVGLAASYIPALRATRVDPAVCLRWE
jgi:ABC-type antimicrobial peptide transport system permease subunit